MNRRTDLMVRVMANIDRVNPGVTAGDTPRARHVRETFAHA
jgi:hypothetical protein